MDTKDKLPTFATAFVLGMAFAGCLPKRDQMTVESEALASLKTRIMFYEAEIPGVQITNTAQLFGRWSDVPGGYPHWLDQRFRPYGIHAGFSNSVYEKYVFFPRGFSNSFVPGELLMMSSQPFPDHGGNIYRVLLSKTGTNYNDYWPTMLPEVKVQKMFQEIGKEIPKPPAYPFVAPVRSEVRSDGPVHHRILRFLDIWARHWGMGSHGYKILLWASAFLAVILLVATTIFMTGRRKKQ